MKKMYLENLERICLRLKHITITNEAGEAGELLRKRFTTGYLEIIYNMHASLYGFIRLYVCISATYMHEHMSLHTLHDSFYPS